MAVSTYFEVKMWLLDIESWAPFRYLETDDQKLRLFLFFANCGTYLNGSCSIIKFTLQKSYIQISFQYSRTREIIFFFFVFLK